MFTRISGLSRKLDSRCHRVAVAGLVAALLCSAASAAEWSPPVATASPGSQGPRPLQAPTWLNVHWIIDNTALTAMQVLDADLVATYFNNDRTFVLGIPQQPVGEAFIPEAHLTSLETCGVRAQDGCESLDDAITGGLNPSKVPWVMADFETWLKTLASEAGNPIFYMNSFVQTAHGAGFHTVMAPDQNLAAPPTAGVQPGLSQGYEGGESTNWQTYLRLGLASVAAAPNVPGEPPTEAYHIMAQPFEAQWCVGVPQGGCEGSEAYFTDFVKEASLQAGAAAGISPNLTMTAGLSNNTRYNATPQVLYQDSLDVYNENGSWSPVQGFWLNIVGGNPGNTEVGIQYLEMLSDLTPLYAAKSNDFTADYPSLKQAPLTAPLTARTTLLFVSSATYPEGTVIPAGTYKLEPFTDGTGSGSATLVIDTGYCTDACDTQTSRTSFLSSPWTIQVTEGDPGVVQTTASSTSTKLPRGAHLYWSIRVKSAAATFNLLYGSGAGGASTNLALPLSPSLAYTPHTAVVFPGAGAVVGQNAPLLSDRPVSATPSDLDLSGTSNGATFVSQQSLPSGSIPAGAWEFQSWIDGSPNAGSATLSVEVGYCSGNCSDANMERTVIIPASAWQPVVQSGARGAALPTAAYTTTQVTTIPADKPYHLYTQIGVVSPAPLHLLFGSAGAPTNVAMPFVMPKSP